MCDYNNTRLERDQDYFLDRGLIMKLFENFYSENN